MVEKFVSLFVSISMQNSSIYIQCMVYNTLYNFYFLADFKVYDVFYTQRQDSSKFHTDVCIVYVFMMWPFLSSKVLVLVSFFGLEKYSTKHNTNLT